jgi:hypothetical protein
VFGRRYRRLVARGKNANIAVVAVARELAEFIWDISRLTVIRESSVFDAFSAPTPPIVDGVLQER